MPVYAAPDNATWYTDLATLKLALKVTDTDRDTLLCNAIGSASRSIDKLCGRRFYLDDTATAKVFRPKRRVRVQDDGDLFLTTPKDIGSLNGLVVETGRGSSWSTVTSSDYELYPEDALDEGLPIMGFRSYLTPWAIDPTQRIRVTARWGWPVVPDLVQEATVKLAARLFKRKDSPEGVIGTADWGVMRVSRTDPDVIGLVGTLALPGFGS